MNLHDQQIPSPCFVVDETLLQKNLELLKYVQEQTGVEILMALKGFSMHAVFGLARQYLVGISASSYNEARLGREEFGKQVHLYAPSYKRSELASLMALCDHMVINSGSQWDMVRSEITSLKGQGIPIPSFGLRVNPEYSEVAVQLYNPCAPKSRFGIKLADFQKIDLTGIDGLHFHTMCEQGSDVLERTLKHVLDKFSYCFSQLKWINLGGGHHITQKGYDVEKLITILGNLRNAYPHLKIYMEPGEAIALNTGFYICEVVDIIDNDGPVAVVDGSATCHLPDVLEMPYRPELINAGKPSEKKYTYRLGGGTCLAGDVIGDYSFDCPLSIGQRLVFTDMAHYTMVKTTTFNGINLPSIAVIKPDGKLQVIKSFGYEDFKGRLS